MYWVLQSWTEGPTGQVFELIPLIILLGIVLFFIGKMLKAVSSGAGGAAPSTGNIGRRNFIEGAVWTSVSAILVAVVYPTISNNFADETPSIGTLTIESGTTHTIRSVHDQEYDGIIWEETGQLDWEQGGKLTLHQDN